jgi:hypothetical protein
MSDRITAEHLRAALQVTFPLPEYATFFEVTDATGGRASRSADAVSIACWPSRGLLVWGFEIKVSRSDWLREKKDPEKSCAIQKYCDRWVLVTSPKVINDGELPLNWGHYEYTGGRLQCRKQAPELKPEQLDRLFLASLLRNAAKAHRALAASELIEERQSFNREFEERVKREAERISARQSAASVAIDRFKEATGIDLCEWSGEQAGPDFAIWRKLRELFRWERLDTRAKELTKLAAEMQIAAKELRDLGIIEDKAA